MSCSTRKKPETIAETALVSAVLWGSIWGLSGAVLSVPLLGVTKLLLDAADYPMAKQALHVIRCAGPTGHPHGKDPLICYMIPAIPFCS